MHFKQILTAQLPIHDATILFPIQNTGYSYPSIICFCLNNNTTDPLLTIVITSYSPFSDITLPSFYNNHCCHVHPLYKPFMSVIPYCRSLHWLSTTKYNFCPHPYIHSFILKYLSNHPLCSTQDILLYSTPLPSSHAHIQDCYRVSLIL